MEPGSSQLFLFDNVVKMLEKLKLFFFVFFCPQFVQSLKPEPFLSIDQYFVCIIIHTLEDYIFVFSL